MSGGHWDYGEKLENGREAALLAAEMFRFMAAIEHELDWGLCYDTCLNCASLRCTTALIAYFYSPADTSGAIALCRDHEQSMCEKCEKRTKADQGTG